VRKVAYRPLSNPPLPGILAMTLSSLAASLPVDGRQSQTALAIARGTARYLHALGYCVVSELPLPSGRRADLVALGGDGEIVIVEIKSSVADFRADQKWMDYRLHCDRLFFATIAEVPCEIFPADAGLIVADAFGAASILCEAPEHRMPAATRKAIMLRLPTRRRCACRRWPIRRDLTLGNSEACALGGDRYGVPRGFKPLEEVPQHHQIDRLRDAFPDIQVEHLGNLHGLLAGRIVGAGDHDDRRRRAEH